METGISSYNQAAASSAQDIINNNLDKFRTIVKRYPGIVAQHMGTIENIGKMSGDEAQAAVKKFCGEVEAHAKECANDAYAIGLGVKAAAAKAQTFESFAETFKELGAEFSEAQGIKAKIGAVAKIVGVFFYTMARELIKGAVRAALWIAATGVRVICTAASFVIKLITKAVKTARNLLGMSGRRELPADEVVIDVEGVFV